MLRSKSSRVDMGGPPPPAKRAKIASSWDKGLESPSLCCTPPGWLENTESRAGAETLQRIHSVERVFCSQSLSTPYGVPKGMEGAATQRLDSQDEFTISYSQHYSRPSSQGQSLDSEEDKTQADCECEGASQQPRGLLHGVHGVSSGADWGLGLAKDDNASSDSITPELAALPECAGPPKLFPVFRRKAEWKTVHVIRHGESEFNAATKYQPGFEDPQIFDPHLTTKGRAQLLPASCTATGGCRTVIRPELSEHLMTTGDVGVPTSNLKSKFPQLSPAMDALEERWWYKACSNDAITRTCPCYEPRRSLVERVGVFRKWLMEQPEKVVVVFGHSTMLREFIGGDKSLRNCELYSMQV